MNPEERQRSPGPRKSKSAGPRRAARGLLLAPLWLAGCSAGVLDPKGPIGAANKTILFDSLVIMLAIVIPTIVVALGFAWWFRASNTKATHLPDWEFSGRIEMVVWSIPLMVILLLGGVTWIGSHELDPGKPIDSKVEPLEIQVVSLDWKWLFIYPKDNVASINRLVVPAGTPLHFRLTSASVMNTFFVPQLGSMIYTMNGMATTLWLHADQPGQYAGMSAMFSGDGFPDMHFPVDAMPAERYAAWVAEARAQGPTALDRNAYEGLMKQTHRRRPPDVPGRRAGHLRAHRHARDPAATGSVDRAPGRGHGEPGPRGASLTCSANSPGTRFPSANRCR